MNKHQRLVAIAAVASALGLAFLFKGHESPNRPDSAPLFVLPTAQLPLVPPDAPEESFDAANLQVGLEALCDSADQAAGSSAEPPQDEESEIREAEEVARRISERLSVSSSPEHLYVAALQTSDRSEKAALLKRAVDNAPTDAFLVWSAYELCSVADYLPDCPMAAWEQLLIDADGGNSQVWVRIATNRYAAGDQQGALDAMRYAASAAETRRYWPETIVAVESALAAVGGSTFEERAMTAFGMTAAIPYNLGEIAMCREMSPVNPEWSDVCLRYGQLAERQGKTELGKSLARSIQKIVLTSRGDTEALAVVEQRIQAWRQRRDAQYTAYDPLIEYLLVSVPDFFHAYLDAVKSVGEYTARERVAAEIRQLVQDQPELACTPVPEYLIPAE